MEQLGSVQQKISCVFETAVVNEQSTKRDQPYKVIATKTIKKKAIESEIYSAKVSEKLDGTCVYIAKYADQPWLWARLDRKPNKMAERRFRKFQAQQQKQAEGSGEITTAKFSWNLEKDFKDTPPGWIPASGVEQVDGIPLPDNIGHTPGWVPVDPSARQHCWHLTAVDLSQGLGLVLREEENSDALCIESVPLSKLEGHTAELIGTNINGNPYGIGSKKCPIHLLVIHGSVSIRDPPQLQSDALRDWLIHNPGVEGIVWHCANKSLFKLHRNHVGLKWPVQEPLLSRRQVKIMVDIEDMDFEDQRNMFVTFSELKGKMCENLAGLETLLTSNEAGVFSNTG